MLIKIRLKSKMAHFGTAFSNHTSKLSHMVPSKSAMNGMLGAARGLDFLDSQEQNFRFSFIWLNGMDSQLIAKKRLMIDIKNNVKNVLRSKDWERGVLPSTIDYEEHLYNVNGFLEAYWFIEVTDTDTDIDLLVSSILNPIFPMYLGKAEHLVRVIEIEVLDIEKKYDSNLFSGFFVGAEEDWVMKERMVEKMKGYRNPSSFEDVYTLKGIIRGVSKYGYYEIEDNNISVW